MKQRGSLLFELLLYAAIAAAVAGVLYGAWYQLDHWHNSAYKDVARQLELANAENAKLKKERNDANDRAAGLQAQLDADAVKYQQEIKANAAKHAATVDQLRRDADYLSKRNASLSSGLLRLWQRASDSANQAAGAPAAPQGSNGPTAEVPATPAPGSLLTINERDLALFATDASAAYGACAVRLRTCVSIYNDAREAQLKSNQGVNP